MYIYIYNLYVSRKGISILSNGKENNINMTPFKIKEGPKEEELEIAVNSDRHKIQMCDINQQLPPKLDFQYVFHFY